MSVEKPVERVQTYEERRRDSAADPTLGGRWRLAIIGGVSVLYSVLVLGYAETSPDVRIRALLADDSSSAAGGVPTAGVVIRATPNLVCKGLRPVPGDRLLGIAGRPVTTFLDMTRTLAALRNQSIPPGGQLHAGADPSEHDHLPPLVQAGDQHRWVRIEFTQAETGKRAESWLLIQSLPFGDVALSFTWFLMQLGVFVVGATAFWHRSFDRPVRLFFAMCIVTLPAFIGGFHWWVIAGNFWLNVPFASCALLVPVVTLHFFLVYPRPKRPLSRHPRLTLAALYAAPALTIALVLGLLVSLRWPSGVAWSDGALDAFASLRLLRSAIYGYLALSGAYFVLTLAALVTSFFTTRNPIEHSQVKWILWAGLFATIPLGYAMYLAQFDREAFALGAARGPMFLASLSFMLAYAVAIVRHKLMLSDPLVSRGVAYYAVSSGLTILFSATVALGVLAPQLLNVSLTLQQGFEIAAVLALAVMLLLWLRDRVQQLADRRFFREKYQLDKALERMNRAVGHLADPRSLGERMLASCRDVLRVERAALYLPTGVRGQFRLVAFEGHDDVSLQISIDDDGLEALVFGGTLQRITPDTRDELTPVQKLLRDLRADLVHVLEIDGEIAGLVVLGERTGAAFSAEDLTFLSALGQITNVALHSARAQQDMTRLNEELRLKTDRIVDQRRQIVMLQSELTSRQGGEPAAPTAAPQETFRRDALRGSSPAILGVLDTVRKVASSESTVLIRGESGTGKELLAQVLHDNSPRRDGPMIRVHCASLAPSLLESELFGHAKGAFTGAHQDRIGRFEAANGGTLFLDEIGDISLETQVKLLRALQERCFEPVGSSRTIHVDVRLLTATHQNLERLISEGRFREDLYYRLNVISVALPPLRERTNDVLELGIHFLGRAAERSGKRISHFDDEALAALERHDWPGNVRELQNVIERAVVLAEENRITLKDLPLDVTRGGGIGARRAFDGDVAHRTEPIGHRPARRVVGEPAAEMDLDAERRLLLDALRRSGGNKARAARLLGLPRSTYFSKLKKHAIDA